MTLATSTPVVQDQRTVKKLSDPSINENTLRTRAWLDGVYATRADAEHYVAHEVVFGFGSGKSSPHHAPRIARTGRILAELAEQSFTECLDVGAGEAYTADLIRKYFGVPVTSCDLSGEGCRRGRELFGVPTFACNASRLPLGDRSFDLVVCSEVIEHLEDPLAAISELMRVTNKVLLLTTMECCHLELERRLMLKLRPLHKPHLELNWWMPSDFSRLMGKEARSQRILRTLDPPGDRETDLGKVRGWLQAACESPRLEKKGDGILVLWCRDREDEKRTGSNSLPPDLWDRLLEPRETGKQLSKADDRWMRERLRCPICLGELIERTETLACESCDRAWPDYHEIPDLIVLSSDAAREMQLIDEGYAERLRGRFSRANSWSGPKAQFGKLCLRLIQLVQDLRQGKGARRSIRAFRNHLREWMRDLDASGEGWLVRAEGRPEVYRIDQGKRRHIATEQVFHDLGYIFDQVKEVDPAWLEKFPEGAGIDSAAS